MSKTIKLEDKTYTELETFRGKRETFSGAVDRLLVIREGVATMRDVLEGNAAYAEYKRAKHEPVSPSLN